MMTPTSFDPVTAPGLLNLPLMYVTSNFLNINLIVSSASDSTSKQLN